MSDRIFGVIGLFVAMVFAYQATIIQESFLSDVVGPKAFPLIIATLMAICSIVFILRPDAEPQWPALATLGEIAMCVIVMIAYAELLPVLGFLIASALAAAFLSWRLGATAGKALLIGPAISIGIYVVFRLILGLSLARGLLGV